MFDAPLQPFYVQTQDTPWLVDLFFNKDYFTAQDHEHKHAVSCRDVKDYWHRFGPAKGIVTEAYVEELLATPHAGKVISCREHVLVPPNGKAPGHDPHRRPRPPKWGKCEVDVLMACPRPVLKRTLEDLANHGYIELEKPTSMRAFH
jgi:hypothetical protein